MDQYGISSNHSSSLLSKPWFCHTIIQYRILLSTRIGPDTLPPLFRSCNPPCFNYIPPFSYYLHLLHVYIEALEPYKMDRTMILYCPNRQLRSAFYAIKNNPLRCLVTIPHSPDHYALEVWRSKAVLQVRTTSLPVRPIGL